MNPTLTKRRIFGYETGVICESVVYNAFYVYFIIFLTNVVGINPVLAGTISLLSVMVDAVTDPLCGWLIDKPKTNQKLYMLVGGILTGVFFGLTFVVVGGSTWFKMLYYVLVSSMLWVAYTAFSIPYYACAVRMTGDYDELTKIRGVSATINSFAIYGGCVLPIVFITRLGQLGVDPALCWTIAAFLVGAVSIVFGIVNYLSIKNVKFEEKLETTKPTGLIKTYKDIVSMKPMWYFIPFVFIYLFGCAMVTANSEYLIIYCAGLDPNVIAGSALMVFLPFLVFSPIFTAIATKWDRKHAVLIAFAITAAGLLYCRIHGVNDLLTIYIRTGVAGVAQACFWCLFYDFSYDLIKLDEYKNGENREGAITSFPQFLQKFSNALGLQVFGIILSLVGFNPELETQTQATINGIQDVSTTYMVIALALAALCIILYPINKKTYKKIVDAVERRKNGEPDFHDPDIDKII